MIERKGGGADIICLVGCTPPCMLVVIVIPLVAVLSLSVYLVMEWTRLDLYLNIPLTLYFEIIAPP